MASKRAKFRVEEISDDQTISETSAVDSPESSPQIPTEPVSEELTDTKSETESPKEISGLETKTSSDEIKDWLKDVKPDTNKEVEKSSSFNMKIILVVAIIVLVVGAIVGGFFYYKKGVTKPTEVTKPQPLPVTIIPTTPVSPTEAAKAEVSLKDTKVQVLNGSGKVGEAGVVKTALSKGGFTEANISAGNASSYDFKDTEVALKEGVDTKVFDEVKKLLGDKYNVVKSDKALAKDSKYDVSIIVGTAK